MPSWRPMPGTRASTATTRSRRSPRRSASGAGRCRSSSTRTTASSPATAGCWRRKCSALTTCRAWSPGWSNAQKRAYVLADNKLALNADWDRGAAPARVRAGLRRLNFDLSLTGFSNDRDRRDPARPRRRPHRSRRGAGAARRAGARPGDVWMLRRPPDRLRRRHRQVTAAAALAGVKPHLMVTDPPYGVNYDPSWRSEAGVNMPTGGLGQGHERRSRRLARGLGAVPGRRGLRLACRPAGRRRAGVARGRWL